MTTETWKAVCREEWYQMHILRSLKEAEDFAKWHNRDTGHIVDVERATPEEESMEEGETKK
jgi:hypothetical protein